MNKEKFFYEHLGHMQFSILTLKTFEVLQRLTGKKIGKFILWDSIRKEIEKEGFSKRQAEGELDRFCYGFECLDRYDKNGSHEIALTYLGQAFLDQLIKEAPYQSSQLAFLVRPAKRNNFLNVIIQESTFFKPEIYELIKKFGFRPGGAREFLKSIPVENFLEFLSLAFEFFSVSHLKINSSIGLCIDQVAASGKYWASVGGKYSWFVFAQKFELDFESQDWKFYDNLIMALIRPPEWGGGKKIDYHQLVELLKNENRVKRFREHGIIRPLYPLNNKGKTQFCLTSPGYLMWERKKKGFLFEFRARKIFEEYFELALCNASDFSQDLLKRFKWTTNDSFSPTLVLKGKKEKILEYVHSFVTKQQSLPI